METFEKLVLVTRKTRLEELIERFNSRGQARFYIEHAGGHFQEYEEEDDAYRRSLAQLRKDLAPFGLKLQLVDRGFVPTFLFGAADLVVTVGQDGLVANTAKYVGRRPIVAVNPDPQRFDGVLLPFLTGDAPRAVRRVIEGSATVREVTLAETELNDGQRLLAFNDLYLGMQSHVSSRYRIRLGDAEEPQSSSGVIVSTGAGSTGWLSSVFNMVDGVAGLSGGGTEGRRLKLRWEDPRLVFVVREPFASKHSGVTLRAGLLEPGQELVLESQMPSGGVIFSDGMERDFVGFNSGAIARVRAAAQRARLVTG